MDSSAPIDDPAELTRHIETRYHARHRQQLPDLVKLAEMIEDIHGEDGGAPIGLTAILRRMIGEMEVHMKKEELILFPAIRKGGVPGIEQPITVMRADHDGHDADLAQIRKVTNGFTLPEGACTSWATLNEKLREFTDDLTEHMRLENEILFPQFENAEWPEI
jgi:regulator of cell morphogenesis and NO signaling